MREHSKTQAPVAQIKLTVVVSSSEPHYTLSRISSKAKAAIHLEGEFLTGRHPTAGPSFQQLLEIRKLPR